MVKEVIFQPSIFVGLIVVIGLLLQKKPIENVIIGTIKSMIGMQIIITGSSIITDSVLPFNEMFQQGFHISGTMLNVEAASSIAISQFGTDISIVMILGIMVNLFLARITRYRYIFTTGQHVLYMSSIIVVVLEAYHVEGFVRYLIGALSLGIIMVLSPAILQRYTVKICKNEQVAMGHFGSLYYLLSACLGKIYGNQSKSIQEIKIPKWLSFIRDTSVILCITMAGMYIIVALIAGKSYIEGNLSGGEHYIVYAISKGIIFTIGFIMINTGIRWFTGEMIPAMKGFANKWIPNAKATVDCPLVFPYTPNAIILGFLVSFFGGLCSLLFMLICDMPIILPSVVPHFFCGATAAVYGNETGGVRGACIGSFVTGVIMSFMPLLFLPHLGTMAAAGVTFAESEFGIVALCLGKWFKRVGSYGTLTILIGIIIIMALLPEMLEDREEDVPWFITDSSIYEKKQDEKKSV
ncbi:MAG: PTS ascorbate transporter subunit IIC [Lachnospiraceae bacterium]|nr:PTS ascorbate transporter subunit IIC [Lachnospiraceae bacterium]